MLKIIKKFIYNDYLFHYIDENSWKAIIITIKASKYRNFINELNEFTKDRLSIVDINKNINELNDIFNEQRDFNLIIAYIQNNEDNKALMVFNDMLWESRKRFIYFLFNDEVYIEVR